MPSISAGLRSSSRTSPSVSRRLYDFPPHETNYSPYSPSCKQLGSFWFRLESEVWLEEKTDRCCGMVGQVQRRLEVCSRKIIACGGACLCVPRQAKFSPSSSRISSLQQSVLSIERWPGDHSSKYEIIIARRIEQAEHKEGRRPGKHQKTAYPLLHAPFPDLHSPRLLTAPVHTEHEIRFPRGLRQEH